MKKNSIISIKLLLVLFLAVSCEDFLDQEPPSSISDAVFWKTNDDAELGIAAVYDALQDTYKTKHFYWGEFRSDNMAPSPGSVSNEVGAMITNGLTSQYDNSLKWDDFYKAISRANTLIKNIPSIENYSTNTLGEAYAIRAYLYFDAYRVWGGVPIFTSPVTSLDESAYRSRSTAQEVLDLVIADLEEATNLITVPENQFRFSIASLSVLKAKVHMHLQDYVSAKADLQVLDNIGKHSLVNGRQAWTDLFRTEEVSGSANAETGSELIFSIKNTLSEDGNNAAQHHVIFFQGVPNSFMSQLIVDKWTSKFPLDQIEWETKYPGIAPPEMTDPLTAAKLYGDWRYYETADQTKDDGNFRISKYHLESGNSKEDDTDVVVYRYADVVLMKAIIENEMGNAQGAIDLMNEVRVSRELPTISAAEFTDVNDKNEVLDYILDERQLELFAEGVRWWDLLSNNKAIEVMNATYTTLNAKAVLNSEDEIYTTPLDTETILWPIFVDHLIDNDKLGQNTAYDN